MSCWSKLHSYSFKTRMKRIIALAVEDGDKSECEVCYCLCSLLAQQPPPRNFSPSCIQLTNLHLSSESLPALSSWTRLEKSPQCVDQPHLKLRTIIFKRALHCTWSFYHISLLNFHPIHPEGYFANFTNPIHSLSHSHSGWENRIARELPLPSTTKPMTSWPLPPCALPLLPMVLASWPNCSLALMHLCLLLSRSPELSLSHHSLFLLNHYVSPFLLDDFLHHIDKL